MANIDDVMNKLNMLNTDIKKILKYTGFDEYEELSEVEHDKADPNALMMLDEFYNIMEKLSNISHNINYLNRPVIKEGILRKNEYGRYEIEDYEFRCGYGIEYLASDERHCRYDDNGEFVITPYWKAGCIEHNGNDYYIVGAGNIELEGLTVRVRL